MARVKVHALCLRPLNECDCPDDDEPDGPAQDDGTDGEDHLTVSISGSVTTERGLLDRLQERFA